MMILVRHLEMMREKVLAGVHMWDELPHLIYWLVHLPYNSGEFGFLGSKCQLQEVDLLLKIELEV